MKEINKHFSVDNLAEGLYEVDMSFRNISDSLLVITTGDLDGDK